EVREETGLEVKVGDLAYVAEFWDQDANEHKVECFFLAMLEAEQLPQGWKDGDGPVQHVRFVAEEEWKGAVYPEFLRHVGFDDAADRGGIYRGFDRGGSVCPSTAGGSSGAPRAGDAARGAC